MMKRSSRAAASCWCLVFSLLWTTSLPPVLAFDSASIPDLPGGFPDLPGESDFPGIPGDFDFPILVSSNPFSGQTQVPVNSSVSFTFLTAMAPSQSITWSANLASTFNYSWSADGKTLTCVYVGNFPTNAVITWTLNPSGFKSQAGTELLPANNTGTFTTASGSTDPNDPCNPGSTNITTGAISLFKSIDYLQTSAGSPSVDPENGPSFLAVIASPEGKAVTEASMQLPNGTTKTIPKVVFSFLLSEEFKSQAALDEAYPPGVYRVTIKQGADTSTVTLNFAAGAPTTPQVSNIAQTEAYDPTADFNLQWLAFAGVTPNDSLFLSIHDAAGTFFNAPDLCIPRPLANTATSIVIPRNTFAVGGDKEGSLSFTKVSDFSTNALPNMTSYAAYTKNTHFTMRGSGEPPAEQPQLQNLARQQNGAVLFDVKAKAGAILTVEGSTDLREWVPVTVGPAVTGLLNVNDPAAAGLPQRFYRAKTP